MYGEEYSEDEPGHRRKKLILQVLAGLGILAAVVAGLYLYHDRYGISSEERFDREVAEDRIVAQALEPLRKHYPYEYDRLRRAAAEEYNLDKHGRVLDHIPSDFFRNFTERHAVEALQGGDKETLAVVQAYAALFDQAAKDTALCQVVNGNEDQMSDARLVFGQKPFTHFFGSFVVLSASGRGKTYTRKPPSFADLDSLRRERLKIDPNSKPTFRADPATRCKEGNTTAKALLALPQQQQINLMGVLFQSWR